MAACPVCGAEEHCDDVVEQVFRVGERYVLVDGIPARVCVRCGEQTFSREATECVRRMVQGRAAPARSIPLGAFEFTQGGTV